MAYTYVWPSTLPQSPQKGFSETKGALVLRTPMDSGPAKLRRRANFAGQMSVSFLMTTAQVSTLDTFITSTIKGTIRFGFTHPRTKQVVEVRIVPTSSEGQLYTITYSSPEYWTVSLTLEILP